MKGDFSFVGITPDTPYTGVRHQQGRVLLDRDWNDAQELDALWTRRAAGDTFGLGVLAVPATSSTAFQVGTATQDAAGVHIAIAAGRAWASGVPVVLPAGAILEATYLEPPLVPAATHPGSIAPGVRDAVVLEVFEDTVSGFQDPTHLIEPALGGPDTTGRVRSFFRLRLLRLGPNEDCSAVAGLIDDPAGRGKLSVSPAPAMVIAGDCPLEAGGGYTGLEHFLYRIEVGTPSAAGAPRFKWSQFNGGLVGRGLFTAAAGGTGTLAITANDQAINTCGVAQFYLEALAFDTNRGTWEVTFAADADRTLDGVLSLTNTSGVWPAAAGASGFFRLWNGISEIAPFAGAAPVDFVDGLQLKFDPPTAGGTNYRPGDYWTFPVRATGAAFDPPVWPLNAPAQGVTYWRVALAEIHWQAAANGHSASFLRGEIEDCRHIFRPLSRQKICCSYLVGDGKTSFGDFNSVELALRHLPAAGGEICLLPGIHTTNAVIRDRRNITIRGCGARTRVLPRPDALAQPIVLIVDSQRVEVEHIDFVTLGGPALWVEGSRPGLCDDVLLTRHRILACTHAVFARHASHLTISHNRIRMFDRAEGRAAIDVSGEDILIERNDIALVPAERTPPVDPDNPDEPVDPVDPCLRFVDIFRIPLVFNRYVSTFWSLKLPLLLFLGLLRPYRALGGIQLRGGCERVRVLENTVIGGAGNGITLGAQVIAEQPQEELLPEHRFEVMGGDARVRGRVLGPDGKPMAGVVITVTRRLDGMTQTATSTSPDGEFIMGLPEGEYDLTEGAIGFGIDKLDARPLGNDRILLLTVVLKASEAPPTPEEGFLYDISIEGNHLSAMGMNGIGTPLPVPRQPEGPILLRVNNALAAARNLLGWPVIGLEIRGNRIDHNLRNPFDATLRAFAQSRGLGGISLGLVDRLQVTGNRIEANGRNGTDPVCGVFVQYGESIELSHNVIVDNGEAPGANQEVQDGQRGGIVLGLAANFGLFARLKRGSDDAAVSSAARVMANHVEQPVGCALVARVFGDAMVNDNVFASQRQAVGGLDALAGTVLLSNLAGVNNAAMPVNTGIAGAATNANFNANLNANIAANVNANPNTGNDNLSIGDLTRVGARKQPLLVNAERAAALLPLGSVMFNDNQTRAGVAHRAPTMQLIVGYDDVGFADNQCHCEQAANLYANTLVMGASLRATGNRLREPRAQTNLSLLTIASRANNTSFNQGDHCIVAQDTDPNPPATVQAGNQVLLPSAVCNRFNMITALLYKPLTVVNG